MSFEDFPFDDDPGEFDDVAPRPADRIAGLAGAVVRAALPFDMYDLARLLSGPGAGGPPELRQVVSAVRSVLEAYQLRRELVALNAADGELALAVAAINGFAPAIRSLVEKYNEHFGRQTLARTLMGARRLAHDERAALYQLVPRYVSSEEQDLLWCRCWLVALGEESYTARLERQLTEEGSSVAHLLEQSRTLLEAELVERAQAWAVHHGLVAADEPTAQSAEREPDGPMVDVFQMEHVLTLTANDGKKDKPVSNEGDAILKRLKDASPRKPLAVLRPGWAQWIEQTRRDFPNFADAIEIIRGQFALSALADGRVRLPALLLVGPPGIGKTELASQLASYVDTDLLRVDMSNAQTNSTLAGSERYWSNATPGGLFQTLAFGRTANPLVVPDEIDKAGGHLGYDPCAPLYGLLEQTTATSFRDLCLPDVPLDASHVLWVAMANDTTHIPEPLLSRFVVVSVPAPSREQTRIIVRNIYRQTRERALWGSFFAEQLDDELVAYLATLPPRRVRVALERAFGVAAAQGRDTLQMSDLPKEDDGRRRIGFV